MFSHTQPEIVLALAVLVWVYLMGAAITAAVSLAQLSFSLSIVRINPRNQRRAMDARVSAGILVTCWAWPILLILRLVSGPSSGSKSRTGVG